MNGKGKKKIENVTLAVVVSFLSLESYLYYKCRG